MVVNHLDMYEQSKLLRGLRFHRRGQLLLSRTYSLQKCLGA